MKEFFDITTGRIVSSDREVKERAARGEVLMSHNEAVQEAKRNRDRMAKESAKKNEYVAGKAAYLLSHGEKDVARKIMADFR